MPNAQGDGDSPRIGLRELALVMHCLPHGRARLILADGRCLHVGHDLARTPASHPSSLLTPCQFRRAMSAVTEGIIEPGWVDTIADAELVSPQCRHLGAGMYAAWCAGVAIHAFSSELPTSVLQLAFEALPDPAPGIADGAGVRLVGAPDLGLTLVTVETPAHPTTPATATRRFARDLQALVLVTELEMAVRTPDTRQ